MLGRPALINLVRNAIEALRDAPAGRISLSAQRDRYGRAAIVAADNGSGIALDQRERIFEPFFSVALNCAKSKRNALFVDSEIRHRSRAAGPAPLPRQATHNRKYSIKILSFSC